VNQEKTLQREDLWGVPDRVKREIERLEHLVELQQRRITKLESMTKRQQNFHHKRSNRP